MAAKHNTESINYNGFALGLNDRALGFCFVKSEGNLTRNIAIFFIFPPKKFYLPQIFIFMTACKSSPAPKSYSIRSLNAENFATFQPTPFIFLCHIAISTLSHGNWHPRDKTTPDKNAGLYFAASRRSKELHQDAILMTSSYRETVYGPYQGPYCILCYFCPPK